VEEHEEIQKYNDIYTNTGAWTAVGAVMRAQNCKL